MLKRTRRGGVLGATLAATLLLPASAALAQSGESVATYQSTDVDCGSDTFSVVVDKDLSNIFFRDADGGTVEEYSSDATALPERQDTGDGYGSYTVAIPEGAVTVSAKAGSQATDLIAIPQDCFQEQDTNDTGGTGQAGDDAGESGDDGDDENDNANDGDGAEDGDEETANPFGVCPDTTALVVPESDDNGYIQESEIVEGATFGDADGVLITVDSVTPKDDDAGEVVGFSYSVSDGDVVEVFVKTGDGEHEMVGETIMLPDEDNTAISFVAFCIGDDTTGDGTDGTDGDDGDGTDGTDGDDGDGTDGNGDGTVDNGDDTTGGTGEDTDLGDDVNVDDGVTDGVNDDESDAGIDSGDFDQDVDADESDVAGENVERPDAPVDEDDVLGAPAVPAFGPAPAPDAPAPAAPAPTVLGVATDADTLPATGTGSGELALLAGLLLLAGAGALRMARSAAVAAR